MVEVGIPQHLEHLLIRPAELGLVALREILAHFLRVDNLVAPAEHDADAAPHDVFAPQDTLWPEEVPREHARNVRVAAREVPQLPLVRRLRLTVHKVVRDRGKVQEEWDGVDEQPGAHALRELGRAHDVCGDDGAVRVSADDELINLVMVEHELDGVEHRESGQRWWGDAHADGQGLEGDDADIGVLRGELLEERDIRQ